MQTDPHTTSYAEHVSEMSLHSLQGGPTRLAFCKPMRGDATRIAIPT